MTDTFNADQANQGTTDQTEGSADNNNATNFDAGNELQRQIDTMQKRMTDKDAHISKIETENSSYREQMLDFNERLDKMGTVEDALTRMKDESNSNQATALDEDTLKSTMRNVIAETTAEERAEANFKNVADMITRTYGSDKADETVRTVATENGLEYSDMVELARKSPEAFYRMAGINTTVANLSAPSKGTHVGFNDDNKTKEQELSRYAQLRKEKPEDFYKPEVQKAFRDLCLTK